MLIKIENHNDKLARLIKDDPIRPEIDTRQRINKNSNVFVLMGEDEKIPMAVTCVKYLFKVPQNVSELLLSPKKEKYAIFYSIWSYRKGAGKELIAEAKREIKNSKPNIEGFFTLSPKSDMVREFHLGNGASVYRENEDSINYEYPQ
jgi:hypothetical protein